MSPSCNVRLWLWALLVFSVAVVVVQSRTISVCCGCHSHVAGEITSLDAALDMLRDSPQEATTISVAGMCTPPQQLTAAHGGSSEATRVRIVGSNAEAGISGGITVSASWLENVTDPAVLEQIRHEAKPFVRMIDLAARGVTSAGTLFCKPYMGGEVSRLVPRCATAKSTCTLTRAARIRCDATLDRSPSLQRLNPRQASILPGNLVSSGIEIFALGDPTVDGDASPLTLARWPNRGNAPSQWANGSVSGYTITPDSATAERLSGWARQLREDPGSVVVHYLGGYKWNDHHNLLESVTLPASHDSTLCDNSSVRCGGALNCSNFEVGYDYYGFDVIPPHHEDTQAACCGACAAMANCSFYSFCTTADACGNTNCYLKNSSAGRKPYANRASGPHAPAPSAASITLTACPSHYEQPGYDALDNDGTYYAYNLLSELDEEGEYYVNRTSMKLYVWLPGSGSSYWQTSPWGAHVVASSAGRSVLDTRRSRPHRQLASNNGSTDPTVAILSINETVLDLNNASFLSFENLTLGEARGAGVRIVNSSYITFNSVLLQNIGNMAMNVTEGTSVTMDTSIIRHAGNGAVFLYAGNRTTLTPSNHTLSNVSLSYSNRYMYCYVPMVALANCGNAVINSEMFGGPHQGIFISGNNHRVERSHLHDLVQAASDSGALYTGRDWTYRGNQIIGNVFERINTVDSGDDVSAVYLDDLASGFNVTDNIFVNVSRALLLGGGRDNYFARNTVDRTEAGHNAVHFDDRGLGWDSAACTPPDGEMIKFLARVPYDSSPVWLAAYPALATILTEQPCVPRGNAIVNNSYCNLAEPFIDTDSATIASWNSTASDNVQGSCDSTALQEQS